MTRSPWTLLALAALGGTASADSEGIDAGAGETMLIDGTAYHRGVAEDDLVMPAGNGELTGQMKLVTADDGLAGRPLKLTDLGLFGVSGRFAPVKRLELSGSVDLLPKQPSYTDEKTWQSVTLGARTPLGKHGAVGLSGGGGHLLASTGRWTRGALTLEGKKPIDRDFLSFDVQAGVDAVSLVKDGQTGFLTEVALATTALFHEPSGHWGAWIGLAYAVPVGHSGVEPTSGLALDPRPRLDLHIGTVLALVPAWDLFVDLAVIDRGDAGMPATQLPILDGGFDQTQLTLGVTRHVAIEHHRDHGEALEIGQR